MLGIFWWMWWGSGGASTDALDAEVVVCGRYGGGVTVRGAHGLTVAGAYPGATVRGAYRSGPCS